MNEILENLLKEKDIIVKEMQELKDKQRELSDDEYLEISVPLLNRYNACHRKIIEYFKIK